MLEELNREDILELTDVIHLHQNAQKKPMQFSRRC